MAASKAPLQVKCPQCGTQVVWNEEQSPYRPFCSKRCRLIDLGEWASEGHRIPGEPAMDETDIDALVARLERGEQQ
ncbi:DNA gyrase inhibitor YacG [Carnimonas nigrificans]|uniref:DNA gyrase inhibitor YacG n=1 Tax=Carnimonas nigrificans TaxID=64323 RepID=UPI00046F74F8|nr:DNA gyrase inhibitor YacG [Carnimonas nigrificans]